MKNHLVQNSVLVVFSLIINSESPVNKLPRNFQESHSVCEMEAEFGIVFA